MWLRKEHIVLRVDDTRASSVFYEALFETPPTHRSAKSTVFDLDSPAVVVTLEERREPLRTSGRPRAVRLPSLGSVNAAGPPRARRKASPWALLVADPRQVGDVAIRLRRAGVRLWVQDEGIEAIDPDGNAWRVRWGPEVRARALLAATRSRGARRP